MTRSPEIGQQAGGRHDAGGGDARAVGQRRGRSHPARVGCARATRRRVAPRRPRCAGALAARRALRARPACGSPPGARRSRSTRPGISPAAAATLARSEELDGAGRRARALPGRRRPALAAGRGAARRPRARAARGGAAAGAAPAPDYPGGARFAVALTHDIDTPWRWSGRGLLGAAARLKGALAQRRLARPRASRPTGLALRAAAPPARQRSQLVARAASPRSSASTASARPASCSRRIAIRTTARRPRPTQRDGGDKLFSYRGGLVFHPTPHRATIFLTPRHSIPRPKGWHSAANNQATPPEKNEIFEIGSKFLFMGGALSLQGALFHDREDQCPH